MARRYRLLASLGLLLASTFAGCALFEAAPGGPIVAYFPWLFRVFDGDDRTGTLCVRGRRRARRRHRLRTDADAPTDPARRTLRRAAPLPSDTDRRSRDSSPAALDVHDAAADRRHCIGRHLRSARSVLASDRTGSLLGRTVRSMVVADLLRPLPPLGETRAPNAARPRRRGRGVGREDRAGAALGKSPDRVEVCVAGHRA